MKGPKNYTPIDDLVKKYLEEKKAISRPKESEPALLSPERHFEVKEVVEKQIEDKEIEPYVEVRKETPKISSEEEKHGVTPSTTGIKFPEYRKVKVPISDEKIMQGLRAPVTSSFRWLAELARYILRQAHISLRKVHGKVVRVFTSP